LSCSTSHGCPSRSTIFVCSRPMPTRSELDRVIFFDNLGTRRINRGVRVGGIGHLFSGWGTHGHFEMDLSVALRAVVAQLFILLHSVCTE
jgi:hypothetical protein